jgi:glycosyltransferase involved in cell wall biosynthesis
MLSVSIVVPTYNRCDLIGETINSLLAQDLPAAEIIVVDDGSTDETSKALSHYGSKLRGIRLPNGGEMIARNTGLAAARTQLVAFCDSDDLWLPEALRTLAAQWETTPDLFACYTDFRVLRNGTPERPTKFESAPQGFWDGLAITGDSAGVFRQPIVDKLLRYQPFFPSCMMVDRERFLAAGGWDAGTTGIVGCDFATTLRVAMHPPIGVVRRPLVTIRKHARNFSADTERMNLGDAQVLDYVLRTRPELSPWDQSIRASAALRRGHAMDSAFARGDFGEVRRICDLMPRAALTAKQRVKRAIAGLPGPVAHMAAGLTSR